MANSRGALALAAVAVVTLCVGVARTADVGVSARKTDIRGNADATKGQVEVQSLDAGVLISDADTPTTNGVSVHVYSATDDLCAILPPGGWEDTGTVLRYKDSFRNSGFLKDGKLKIKLKADPQTGNPLNYTLADNGTRGQANAGVRFGTGQDYCLVCATGNKKDDTSKYLAKDCPAGGCTVELTTCTPPNPTTTTSSTNTTTTST